MEQETEHFTIAVIASDEMMKELESKSIPASCHFIRLANITELADHRDCIACFDLLFEPTRERMNFYRSFYPAPVFINCIQLTNTELNEIAKNEGLLTGMGNMIRINAWPTFLKRAITEIAETNIVFTDVFEKLNWKYEITPDIPGLITARVVSMIINEAYFALEEKVSTREEIDTAMKLGTNYPYGPFEWAEKIGIKQIAELLTLLARTNTRYQPAPSLLKEALF